MVVNVAMRDLASSLASRQGAGFFSKLAASDTRPNSAAWLAFCVVGAVLCLAGLVVMTASCNKACQISDCVVAAIIRLAVRW